MVLPQTFPCGRYPPRQRLQRDQWTLDLYWPDIMLGAHEKHSVPPIRSLMNAHTVACKHGDFLVAAAPVPEVASAERSPHRRGDSRSGDRQGREWGLFLRLLVAVLCLRCPARGDGRLATTRVGRRACSFSPKTRTIRAGVQIATLSWSLFSD